MVPRVKTIAYAIRVDVEDLHDGQALQQKLQAALLKQVAA